MIDLVIVGRRAAFWLVALLAAIPAAESAEPARRFDTQAETTRLTSPWETAARMTVPPGFSVSVFAAEPDVRQPIGLATDSRGRIWVAENYTYAERTLNFDLSQHDRVVILEDTDHDGRADRRKIFWDQGQKLSSVEVGFGGVWVLCPPQLLFIPDRNGDDVPDSQPEVVLDGWDDGAVRHNIANGLRFGPDGWLYGRHGIQATSLVGPPGALPAQRTTLNCAIWRYHPTRKLLEVVCRGTTNPWGMDWNAHGELFFINTVIGHLWHAVPGAHFQRMYGEDDNPHLYELMGQCADHVHWDAAEAWSKAKHGLSPTTDEAGGGHAHAGLLIYQGTNWPDRYRGSLFTINFHGRRLNNDILERRGAGYVGHHAADFCKTDDPWFRGLELIAGPDGGVYVADWCDLGECHEEDGVHRSSGRIYKIAYGRPKPPAIADVAALSDRELITLQAEKNEWLVRQSRRILQERAAIGRPMHDVHQRLRAIFEDDPHPLHKLRALWCLAVTGGAADSWLLERRGSRDEHIRAWIVRLLGDGQVPSPASRSAFEDMAAADPSGLVLLYLASAMRQLPPADRWVLAERLAARSEFAQDRMLPLLVWYGIEPAVPENPARAVELARTSRMISVARLIARRLTEDLRQAPGPVDRLVAELADSSETERTRAVLSGMAEGLRGWRQAPAPASWNAVQSLLASSRDDSIRKLSRELAVVFGDGRSIDELLKIAAASSSELSARRDALSVLVAARQRGVVPLLRRLATDRDLGGDAARGLGVFGESDAAFLLARYQDMKEPARAATIQSLSSRPGTARLLLRAVADGTVERAKIPPFQIRQMAALGDESVRRLVARLWPELKALAAAKRDSIQRYKAQLTPAALAQADLGNGRRRFMQSCAGCHALFGEGAKIGPDLTGGQRMNLDYLLENVVDPSAAVTPDYRMSTVALTDGRVLNAIVIDRGGPTLAVQLPTERVVVNRADVEQIKKSDKSFMPEGLLDVLPPGEVRDLVAYLQSPRQVPLPTADRPRAASSSR